MVERAALNLDPSQKAMAVKSMKQFVHAISVRNEKAAEHAASKLARLFLRLPTAFDVDE